jgi:hypothetical protein
MAKALYTPYGILFAEEHATIAVGVNAHSHEHLANTRRTRPGPWASSHDHGQPAWLHGPSPRRGPFCFEPS